eukprot:9017177-Pyramimonas_sp.AAC.1
MSLAACSWHARAQAKFGAAEFLDSDGVEGTSDVLSDVRPDDPLGAALIKAWNEEGVGPYQQG